MSDLTGHHAPIDYHVALLSDPWRTALWGRAIKGLVRTGDRVLDLGTGLGHLAVLAAQAGGQVTAVESAWVSRIARQTFERSGQGQAITLVEQDFATLPPEPVDLILADFIGRMLPDATMLRAVRAAARWCAAGTRFAPSKVSLHAAPIGDVPLPALDRLAHPLLGVDLTGALPAAWSTAWSVDLSPSATIAPPALLATLTPPDLPDEVAADLTFHASRAGCLRGVIGWFRSELAQGVVLDTGPGYRTFWGQTLWPVPPVQLLTGDEIRLRWTGTPLADGVGFSWEVQVRRDGGEILSHRGETGAHASALPESGPAPLSLDPHLLVQEGQPDLATPELLAALDGGPAQGPLQDLVIALAQRGEHAPATQALELYEQLYGPHPHARRG